MSLACKGIIGGQPSTTQPIAGPWLSPKVVTRNKWPKVLCDMSGGLFRSASAQRQTSLHRNSPDLTRRDSRPKSRPAAGQSAS